MSTQLTTRKQVSQLLESPSVANRLNEILGKSSRQFASALVQVASSEVLQDCDPNSILGAGITAATINLPINQSLGQAYIVPFKVKGVKKAQFQLGYKGLIQLCLRSGEFAKINVTNVKEGEIASFDRMSGDVNFVWEQDSALRLRKKTIGYVAYFRLLNGFDATLYMTKEEVEAHGKKYSQTFKRGFGLWATDFDAMAEKTVLKLLLDKKAPKSIEMQTAIQYDQASVKIGDDLNMSPEYVDNKEEEVDRQKENIENEYLMCTSVEEVESLKSQLDANEEFRTEEYLDLYKSAIKRVKGK